MELIDKLVMAIGNDMIKNNVITRSDIETELSEICDRVHADCHEECPIYRLRGDFDEDCDCFKDGNRMFNFIKNYHTREAVINFFKVK